MNLSNLKEQFFYITPIQLEGKNFEVFRDRESKEIGF